VPKLSNSDKAAKVSANEARRRKETALAELRELEVQQKRGELVKVEDVRNAWATVVRTIRDGVMRIPDKCAPAIAAAADAREVRTLLAAECESILKGLVEEVRGL
jgi:hypothetical protein